MRDIRKISRNRWSIGSSSIILPLIAVSWQGLKINHPSIPAFFFPSFDPESVNAAEILNDEYVISGST